MELLSIKFHSIDNRSRLTIGINFSQGEIYFGCIMATVTTLLSSLFESRHCLSRLVWFYMFTQNVPVNLEKHTFHTYISRVASYVNLIYHSAFISQVQSFFTHICLYFGFYGLTHFILIIIFGLSCTYFLICVFTNYTFGNCQRPVSPPGA